MGGSPGPSAPAAPTSSTSYSTNVPEYLQPYVENMLNATQAQIYQPDMSTFKPYQPYSNNPADYVAGFSPLQQQAQSSAANLQTPEQYGAATGAAAYGTGQALAAGQGLKNTLTSAQGIGQYMNPYLQNTLQPAMQLLNQQYGQEAAKEQGAATGAGAFGGSREALMAGLNQQNQMLAQNQLVGNAYSQAFNNAQQQANQVANLGLQGAQAGIGGASALAGIGGQELGAQQGIINTQAAQGAAEQAQQQQIINQGIQNYATAQQYPYMQLGLLNAELRGLPMQSTTTATYQAQPSAGIQAAGLLGAAGSLYGGKTAKAGGLMKDKVPRFRYGSVINGPQFEAMTERLSDDQLDHVKGLPGIDQGENQAIGDAKVDHQYMRTQAAGLPPPQQAQQPIPMDSRLSGIAQAGGPAFASMGSPTRAATGGILSMAQGTPDDVIAKQAEKADADAAAQDAAAQKVAEKAAAPKAPTKAPATAKKAPSGLEKRMADEAAAGVTRGLSPEEQAQKEAASANLANISEREDQMRRENNAKAFLQLARTAGPIGSNMAGALQTKLEGDAANRKAIEEYKDKQQQLAATIAAGDRARRIGDVDAAEKYDLEQDKLENELKRANIAASAAHVGQAEKRKAIEALQAKGMSYDEAYLRVMGLDTKEAALEYGREAKIAAAVKPRVSMIDMQLQDPNLDAKEREKLLALRQQIVAEETAKYTKQSQTAQQPGPQVSGDGIVDVPGKGKFKQLPNGNYVQVG